LEIQRPGSHGTVSARTARACGDRYASTALGSTTGVAPARACATSACTHIVQISAHELRRRSTPHSLSQLVLLLKPDQALQPTANITGITDV
jgi:hypothetical protein